MAQATELATVTAAELVERLSRGEWRTLDVRPITEFMAGHLPGSANIPYVPIRFRPLLRSLLPAGEPIVLIATDRRAAVAAAADLRTAGHQVHGLLEGGSAAWAQAGHPLEHMQEFDPQALHKRLEMGAPKVVDVREPGEWAAGVIAGAVQLSLGELTTRFGELDPAGEYVAVCGHGQRSLQAAWFLQQKGFAQVGNLVGGMSAWEEAGLPVVPPSAGGHR